MTRKIRFRNYFVEACKDAYHEQTEGMKFTPYRHPESGMLFARLYSTQQCLLRNIYGGAVCGYESEGESEIKYAIITDFVFDQLSENGQRFVINHEVGHILNDEAAVAAVSSGTDATRTLNGEVAADTYAAETMGRDNAIMALIEIRHVMSGTWFISEGSIKELDLRIAEMAKLPV